MNNEKTNPPTWYDTVNGSYNLEQRKAWYSNVARAYQWARPRYPATLINQVLNKANLAQENSLPNSVLEIGCGPGIATVAFADKGLNITAIDPSLEACEIARKSCQDYDQITIVNSRFEEFNLCEGTDQKQYDAVLAATSFHWVDPEIACRKSASALKSGGVLILLWSTPPQPSEEICQFLQPLYEHFDLSELSTSQSRPQAYYQDNFETFAKTISRSGLFQPSTVEIKTHKSKYKIEKYLALLSTLSGYIKLGAKRRTHLLKDLGKALAGKLETDTLETTHWFAFQVSFLKTESQS